MASRIVDIAPGLKAKIESHRREDDPSKLAVDLAEALEDAANFQGDVDAFTAQAEDDRAKAQEIQAILRRIRQAGGDRSKIATINPKTNRPYRMDPAREMDEGALQEELDMRRRRSNEMREKANLAKNKASEARRRVVRVRDQLAKANRQLAEEKAELHRITHGRH